VGNLVDVVVQLLVALLEFFEGVLRASSASLRSVKSRAKPYMTPSAANTTKFQESHL
jgi:hypothetical protein